MPIRFPSGEDVYLQDNSTTFLTGATSATISFFLRNPTAQSFSGNPAGFRYDGNFRFYWSGATSEFYIYWPSGQVSYARLTPGRTHHIAGTLSSTGATRLYRDGLLVHSASNSPGTFGSGTLRFGRYSFGFGTTPAFDIDDLAIWVTDLPQSDIIRLRNRAVAPEDLGGGTLRFYVHADGTGNVTTANVPVAGSGDVAWDSLGGSGAIFLSEPLTIPTDATATIRLAPSRKGIWAVFTKTSDGTAATAQSLEIAPTASLNGGEPVPLPLPARVSFGGIYLRLPFTVGPSDTLTLSAPAGWAVTNTGLTEAMNAQVVINTDAPFYPVTPGPRTMKLGYNLGFLAYWAGAVPYSDLVKASGVGWSPAYPLDEAGWPTGFSSSYSKPQTSIWTAVFGTYLPDGTAVGAPARFPAGNFTLRWTGPPGSSASITGACSGVGGMVASGPGWAQYSYNPPVPLPNQASIALLVSHPGMRVQVYPPGVPGDGSQKFSPHFLRQVEGARLLRFLNPTLINASNTVTASDFTPPDNRTYTGPLEPHWRTFRITRIDPWSDPLGIFEPGYGWTKLKVTTADPHGMVDGNIHVFPNNPTPLTIQLSGGTFNCSNYRSVVKVLSPTEFAVMIWTNKGPMTVSKENISVASHARPRGGMPWNDVAELCTVVGADCWVNVPHALDDAGVATMIDMLLDNLGPGLKLWVEYTNEHWNTASNFEQSRYCSMKAVEEGMGSSTDAAARARWYTKRAGQVHAIARARAALRGRENDVVRVMGSMVANSSITHAIVDYAYANNIPIDRLAVAPYHSTRTTTVPGEFFDACDLDQLMDNVELSLAEYPKSSVSQHRGILRDKFPTAEICCYEGGMERLLPGTTAGYYDKPASNRARALFDHPRLRHAMLRYLQNMQEGGATEFAYFDLTGAYSSSSHNPQYDIRWAVYTGPIQEAGMGDGSDGKFDNRTDYLALHNHVSVIGGANKTWMSWVETPPSPPPPPPPPSTPPQTPPRVPRRKITPRQMSGRPGRSRR